MAGYVKDSKAYYKFLIAILLDISNKLKSEDVSYEERAKLYKEQSAIIDKLMEHFEDGKPE